MNQFSEPKQIIKIFSTPTFDKWFENLKDNKLIVAINRRLDKIATNKHFGDHKNISGKLYELRIFLGAGIRIYYSSKIIRNKEIL